MRCNASGLMRLHLAAAMACITGTACSASVTADEFDVLGTGGRSGFAASLGREYPEGAEIISGACSKIDVGSGGTKLIVYLLLPRSKADGYVVDVNATDKDPVAIGQVLFEKGKLHIGESSGGFGLDEALEAEANYLLQKPLHYHRTFRAAVFERPWQRCPNT